MMGRETYLTHLLRALLRLDSSNDYVLYVTDPLAPRAFQAESSGRVEWRVLASRSTVLQRSLLLPRALRRDRIEVFYLHTLGAPFYSGKTVLALHGIQELWAAAPMTRILLRTLLPWSLRTATAIVTNSGYTRDEAVRGYGAAAEKIHVVHGGVDPAVFHPLEMESAPEAEAAREALGPDQGPEEPFCLYLGAIETRKNLANLIDGYARARARVELPRLLLAGAHRGKQGARLQAELLRLAHARGCGDHVAFFGYVEPRAAAGLLRRARFFLFPSLHESFGFPPLEAMACGTPVLASRVGSLPEVLGDAAAWCDPLDPEDIGEGIARLASDPSLRAVLRAKGLDRARLFTWEDAARRTLAVFDSLAA